MTDITVLGIELCSNDPTCDNHTLQSGRLSLVGQQKPAYLLDAIEAAESANADHLAGCDEYEDGIISVEELTRLQDVANVADDHMMAMYRKWNDSFHEVRLSQKKLELVL